MTLILPGLRASTEPGAIHWTDSGVSERWVNSVAGEWCWTAGGGYHQWNGQVWRPRSDAEALEAVREFAKAEAAEAVELGDPAELKVAALRLGDGKLGAALHLARGQMVADLGEFDTDPDILVAGDCVVDLQTGHGMEPDSSRLVTKSTSVKYVPGATHPDWTRC
jgi:putative DNA primase/helicase